MINGTSHIKMDENIGAIPFIFGTIQSKMDDFYGATIFMETISIYIYIDYIDFPWQGLFLVLSVKPPKILFISTASTMILRRLILFGGQKHWGLSKVLAIIAHHTGCGKKIAFSCFMLLCKCLNSMVCGRYYYSSWGLCTNQQTSFGGQHSAGPPGATVGLHEMSLPLASAVGMEGRKRHAASELNVRSDLDTDWCRSYRSNQSNLSKSKSDRTKTFLPLWHTTTLGVKPWDALTNTVSSICWGGSPFLSVLGLRFEFQNLEILRGYITRYRDPISQPPWGL